LPVEELALLGNKPFEKEKLRREMMCMGMQLRMEMKWIYDLRDCTGVDIGNTYESGSTYALDVLNKASATEALSETSCSNMLEQPSEPNLISYITRMLF
jgi:hypothetical protein